LFSFGELLSSSKPPLVTVRTSGVYKIVYGFGDASGKGFGSMMLTANGIKYRIGLWGADDESKLSNRKEFKNQVEALEQKALDGDLTNAVVYFFTDNSTVESCQAVQADGQDAEVRNDPQCKNSRLTCYRKAHDKRRDGRCIPGTFV
jgi:hypothetical protein